MSNNQIDKSRINFINENEYYPNNDLITLRNQNPAITYNIGYSTAPVVVITPANAVTASLSSAQAVWINIGTTNFTINTNSTALSGSIYKWNYVVIQ